MDPKLQLIIFDRTREQGRIHWQGKRLLIGRRPDANIRVDEPTMSGIHAELVPAESGVLLRDLESLNGTRLNGVRITESPLHLGDQIQIGRVRIVVTSQNLAGGLVEEETVDTVPGGRPEAPRTSSGIRSVLAPDSQNTQTVKIRLDQLKASRGGEIEEDERILLLRDLFEELQGEEDRSSILTKTRQVLDQAFRRARVFVLERTGEGWRDPVEVGGQPPSMTFVEETVQSMSAVLSTSLPEDQRFSASERARTSGITTAIAAPTACDGEPVAVVYVDRLGLPPFSMQDLNLLGIAANHISAVLENASRIATLRRTNGELEDARTNLAELNRNLERLVEERTAEIRRQADEIRRLADAKDELMGIAA
ncbi:MAG: FHA domain-containing protein, partial [Holophagales bacterium]|nr:FHA domain-containing protein [Holophagales bacterium]